MNCRHTLLTGMLLVLTHAIHAETVAAIPAPPATPAIAARIQDLEKAYKDQQIASKAEAELLKKETETEIRLLKKQLDQYLFFRDWEARLIMAGIGFILGGGTGFFWTRRKISDIVQQQSKKIEEKTKSKFAKEKHKVSKTLKRLVKEETSVILETFRKTRLEEKFKQESRILIITDQLDNKLENDFERLGFNPDKLKRIPFNLAFDRDHNSHRINQDEYNLIVLDSLENDDLLAYIDSGTQLAYLVYYEGKYNSYPDRRRSNIANSKLTLYPRALEVLLYKHAQRA